MLRPYNQIDIHTRAFELTLSPSLEKKDRDFGTVEIL